jgi:hypothetical protein
MSGSSSWMPYAPQGVKGLDDDDDDVNCIELAKDRDKWWSVVNGVVNFRIFIESGAFDWLRKRQFLNKDSSTWRQLVTFIPVFWSLRLPRYLENVLVYNLTV